MNKQNLKIDPELQSLLPPLSQEEYKQLEDNILKNGFDNNFPIIAWRGFIIDGHNRYKICQEHKITDYLVREAAFNSKEEVMEWMLGVQLGRRNLTDFMKNEIALKYEDLIAKRMKERQKKYYGNQYSEKMDFGPNGPESKVESTRTKAELAKIAGTSQGSIQRSKLILQKGTPEQIQRAREGGKGNTISAIAKEIQEEEKRGKSNVVKPELALYHPTEQNIVNTVDDPKKDNVTPYDNLTKEDLDLLNELKTSISKKNDAEIDEKVKEICKDLKTERTSEDIKSLFDFKIQIINNLNSKFDAFDTSLVAILSEMDGMITQEELNECLSLLQTMINRIKELITYYSENTNLKKEK